MIEVAFNAHRPMFVDAARLVSFSPARNQFLINNGSGPSTQSKIGACLVIPFNFPFKLITIADARSLDLENT